MTNPVTPIAAAALAELQLRHTADGKPDCTLRFLRPRAFCRRSRAGEYPSFGLGGIGSGFV